MIGPGIHCLVMGCGILEGMEWNRRWDGMESKVMGYEMELELGNGMESEMENGMESEMGYGME